MGQKVQPTGFRVGVKIKSPTRAKGTSNVINWFSRWYAKKNEYGDLLIEDQKIREFIKFGNSRKNILTPCALMQKDDREKRKKGGDKQGKEPSQEKGEQKKVEEQKRRKAMIFQGFRFAGIPRIEIERFSNVDYDIDVRIFVARPAVIIGAKGQKIELLTQDLETITGKKVRVRVEEVKEPAKNAQLVAENIAEQLEKRAAFRRSMKKAIELAMAPTLERSSRSRGKTPEKSVRVEGIKIQVSGRLGGAEMARTESISRGKIPLQTLRADIDYGFAEAATTYGNIGVKVWIYKGDIISSEEDLYAAAQKS